MVVFLFLWFSLPTFEGWDTLQKLELVKAYDEFLGEETEVPVFSEELKSFDGKEVTLQGYVIPLQSSLEQRYFVLSRFPYNNCFFCGNAGPETVAEIYTDKVYSDQDQHVEVTGILKLNADDPLHLFFLIEEATVRPVGG
ncbi:hypothetical protein C7460_10780 [Marinoscillum furvescens DSM 4134]|uniref:DUF3299 domain-containing protein n=2 Tax=Marinoscillum furvescens TaxID=1026 RepID=A0A3D9L6K0_MARFU|nr:hypothetical protein C7460_10780 [Marinoscillum furvescens DSM 4134]